MLRQARGSRAPRRQPDPSRVGGHPLDAGGPRRRGAPPRSTPGSTAGRSMTRPLAAYLAEFHDQSPGAGRAPRRRYAAALRTAARSPRCTAAGPGPGACPAPPATPRRNRRPRDYPRQRVEPPNTPQRFGRHLQGSGVRGHPATIIAAGHRRRTRRGRGRARRRTRRTRHRNIVPSHPRYRWAARPWPRRYSPAGPASPGRRWSPRSAVRARARSTRRGGAPHASSRAIAFQDRASPRRNR